MSVVVRMKQRMRNGDPILLFAQKRFAVSRKREKERETETETDRAKEVCCFEKERDLVR